MASFRGAYKSYVQRLLEVTWDVHGAILLLVVPCAGSCQEGEPGEIADPRHSVMSHGLGLWAWLGRVL